MTRIPDTMRAVRCYGPGDYRLETLPVPEPGADEILVQVEACGVCASDGKCFGGAPLFWGDATRPQFVQPPVTPGHELIGRVVALGPGAEAQGLKVGDRAISEQIVPCWKCRYCRKANYHLCVEADVYGFRRRVQGAMADYMIFPAGSLNHKVPEELPRDQAALIEPLACSLRAVERSQMQLGDVVVVAGAGTLGLGMVAFARLRNPGLLISIDRLAPRLDLARSLGADLAIDPGAENAVQRVLDLTEGYGCDVYIEATGHPDAVNQGLAMIRKGGNFVEFSVMPRETTCDWTLIGDAKEINIYGAHLGPHLYPTVIDYLARGLVKVDGIVTDALPLEDYAEGFDRVHRGQGIKTLLVP